MGVTPSHSDAVEIHRAAVLVAMVAEDSSKSHRLLPPGAVLVGVSPLILEL